MSDPSLLNLVVDSTQEQRGIPVLFNLLQDSTQIQKGVPVLFNLLQDSTQISKGLPILFNLLIDATQAPTNNVPNLPPKKAIAFGNAVIRFVNHEGETVFVSRDSKTI